MSEPESQGKSYDIPKRLVWEVESVGAVAASSRRQEENWKINRLPGLAPLFPAILP